MKLKKTARFFGVLIATHFISASVFAGPLLNNSLLGSLKASETKSFESAIAKSLNEAKDGEKSSWQGSGTQKKKRKQPLEGAFEPLKTIQHQGQDCRLLKTSLSEGVQEEVWTMWFCKQQDGKWKSKHIRE